MAGALTGLPLVTGIEETVAWCRRNRLVPVLATLAWSPVGSYLADLPLFASVGMSVAFNASEGARAAATATVDDDDLRAVLPILDAWVTATS